MVSSQSNDPKSQPHAAAYNVLPRDSHSAAKIPMVVVTSVDDSRSDYSTRSRGCLDFGMA